MRSVLLVSFMIVACCGLHAPEIPAARRLHSLNSRHMSSVEPRKSLVESAFQMSSGLLLAATLFFTPISATSAADSSQGFEQFAAQGGVMKAEPSCFFEQCGEQSKACFTNPACLKGITCLGNCRGEQLCATQCFARFGSEKLNGWLSCTLEENECVSTGVKQDTSAFYVSHSNDGPPLT